ncbi:outer membrane protein [Legionella oakridgensis]|nr:outer membrane beta-barrel protein [Legionella oakridgensis]
MIGITTMQPLKLFNLRVTLFLLSSFTSLSFAATNWAPYINIDAGIASEKISDVTFQNPRAPQLAQQSNYSAIAAGSIALGSSVLPMQLPVRLELRGLFQGQSGFNREYYFPSLAVIGIQKLRIQSNALLVQGYYDIPLQSVTPFITLGVGAVWNKTTATQYAPEIPGWTYNFVGTTTSNLAWAGGVGLSKSLTDKLSLTTNLQYVSLGKFDTGVLPKTGDEHIFGKVRAIELLVGVRYLL